MQGPGLQAACPAGRPWLAAHPSGRAGRQRRAALSPSQQDQAPSTPPTPPREPRSPCGERDPPSLPQGVGGSWGRQPAPPGSSKTTKAPLPDSHWGASPGRPAEAAGHAARRWRALAAALLSTEGLCPETLLLGPPALGPQILRLRSPGPNLTAGRRKRSPRQPRIFPSAPEPPELVSLVL